MSTLQVRNVPDDVRQTLKVRAAATGQSLSEYVLGELSRLASQPTLEELGARVRHRGAVEPVTRAADVLSAERDDRRR
jgi:plasmid stability protein